MKKIDKRSKCIFDGEDLYELCSISGPVVISDEQINIKFDYPLNKEVIFNFQKFGGFTLPDLVENIRSGYAKIYKEEEAVASDPGNIQGTLNRAESNGPYGIWGHTIRDLVIEGIWYNIETKTVKLDIGS